MTELRKDGFTFKHFFVAHDKSPMKVTTDSCLLGAWTPIMSRPKTVLDIGCGCGIIALMLAQRLQHSDCIIDAIDIDPDAISQCLDNIHHSPFHYVVAQCADINQYRIDTPGYYDLIVSNPPYFASAVDCRNQQRQQARYTEQLNHQQLIDTVKRLLKPQGQFCLVLSYHLSKQFKSLAQLNQLYLSHTLDVRYTVDKPLSLSLLCFSLEPVKSVISHTMVMRDDNNRYSDEFRQLLQNFYLFRNN